VRVSGRHRTATSGAPPPAATRAARRVAALLLVGALITGCAAQPEQPLTPDPSAPGAPTPAAAGPTSAATGAALPVEPSVSPELVIEHIIDPVTGEPTEVSEPLPGPSTYGEVLDAGIAAGRWDELSGLELVLGHAVGAVPADEVPGVESVVHGELNELLHRAHLLSLSDQYTAEALAGLRRWYELAVPGAAVIERLAATAAQAPNANRGLTAGMASALVGATAAGPTLVAQGEVCAPVDPTDFSSWAVVEGCYLIYQDSVAGVTIRVLYPAWYQDDDSLTDLPLRAREALLRSAETYAPLAEIGDMDLIFSLVDTTDSALTTAVADDDGTWGEDGPTASRGGACPITVFPSALAREFEQTIAHEAWHCVQRENGYPRATPDGHSWFVEGGANYFAFLVYPSTRLFTTFDKGSRRTALWDMRYEAWIWWQYLGSRESPRTIAELHQQMSTTRDGGRSIIEPYSEIFHRFVIELVAGTIPAPGGGTLPGANYALFPFHTVGKDDTGKEFEYETEAFVARRSFLYYDAKLRVFTSEASDPGAKLSMVESTQRSDLAAWRGVFPEIRSKCDKQVGYWIIYTPDEGNKKGKLVIDAIEEAVCDPCLLGTWDLDLDSFQSMIMTGVGPALPAGASFDMSGNYFIAFDDEAVFREQRDKLTISSSYQGFTLDVVIDSFAHGTYSADGENLEVINVVDDYVNVTHGQQTFAQDARVLDGAGTYVCGTDDMTLTIGSHEPLHWHRVDRILEPPSTLDGSP
jgi:hypothetical protein